MKTKDFQTIQTGFVPHPPAKENKGKEKERVKNQTHTANGEMATKANEEIRIIKDPGPTTMGKLIPKIRTKPKEKEMEKGTKGKEKEKASPDTATGGKTTMNGTSKTAGQNQPQTICKKFTYSLRTLRESSKLKQKKTMKISMKLLSTITTRQTNMKHSLCNLHRT